MTTDELYEFRCMYNAMLFNEWAKQDKFEVHKSTRHHDGELCFGGDWFIVAACLPTGVISNHYQMRFWNHFHIPELEVSSLPFDGYTPKDVLERMNFFITYYNKTTG